MPEEREPSIDGRIQALTTNLELLLKHGEEQDRRIDRLHNEITAHEQDLQRFRRALRAGLEAYLGNGDEGKEQQ